MTSRTQDLLTDWAIAAAPPNSKGVAIAMQSAAVFASHVSDERRPLDLLDMLPGTEDAPPKARGAA